MPFVSQKRIHSAEFEGVCAAYGLILGDDVYCGSTTNVRNRMRQHRACARYPDNAESHRVNFTMYRAISENGGWERVRIFLRVCKNKADAQKQEARMYDDFNFGKKCSFNQRAFSENDIPFTYGGDVESADYYEF